MGPMAPVPYARASNDLVPAVDASVITAIREGPWFVFNVLDG